MAKPRKPIAWRRRQEVRARGESDITATFASPQWHISVTAEKLELISSVALQVRGQIQAGGSPPSTERAEAPPGCGSSGRRRP